MTNNPSPRLLLSAEWDSEDPEVESVWILFKDAIKLLDDERVSDEADFRADRILDKLSHARNQYQAIRHKDFNAKPLSEKESTYDSLYADLWSAYKDRLPKMLQPLGYEIGFIFSGDTDFNSQAMAFAKRHPECEWLVDYIKAQKSNWQDGLRDQRNAREHDGDLRNMPDATDINNLKYAKHIFTQVCSVIENIGITLISYKLPPGWGVVSAHKQFTVFDREPRFEIKHSAQMR